MKKIYFSFIAIVALSATNIKAQRCLDLKTAATLDLIHVPSSAEASFRDCHTKANENGSLRIDDYGDNYKAIDTFIAQKSREFAIEKMKDYQVHQISASQMDDAKQLAATVNSMTDEQKKAFAMQMAQQQMSNRSNNSVQDDAATARLVMETQDLSANKLYKLNREFNDKFLSIKQSEENELSKVTAPQNNCPMVGPKGYEEHECNCSNKLFQPYLKQKIGIAEKYNQQKLDLYNEYVPQIKAICTQIDANITKLKMGDAVKTKNFKDVLTSAQSQAFALASEFAGVEQSIRKSGADVYVSFDNSNHNLYITDCGK